MDRLACRVGEYAGRQRRARARCSRRRSSGRRSALMSETLIALAGGDLERDGRWSAGANWRAVLVAGRWRASLRAADDRLPRLHRRRRRHRRAAGVRESQHLSARAASAASTDERCAQATRCACSAAPTATRAMAGDRSRRRATRVARWSLGATLRPHYADRVDVRIVRRRAYSPALTPPRARTLTTRRLPRVVELGPYGLSPRRRGAGAAAARRS